MQDPYLPGGVTQEMIDQQYAERDEQLPITTICNRHSVVLQIPDHIDIKEDGFFLDYMDIPLTLPEAEQLLESLQESINVARNRFLDKKEKKDG